MFDSVFYIHSPNRNAGPNPSAFTEMSSSRSAYKNTQKKSDCNVFRPNTTMRSPLLPFGGIGGRNRQTATHIDYRVTPVLKMAISP